LKELRILKVTMYVIELENNELEALTMVEIGKKLSQLKFQELLNQSSFSTKQRVCDLGAMIESSNLLGCGVLSIVF